MKERGFSSVLWNGCVGSHRVYRMRADRTATASPVNSGFRFDIQECGGEVGRNIEGDTPVKRRRLGDVNDPRRRRV